MLTQLPKRLMFSLVLFFSLLLTNIAMAGGGYINLINDTDYTIYLSRIDGIVKDGGWYESTVPTEEPLSPRISAGRPTTSTSSWDQWMVGTTTGGEGYGNVPKVTLSIVGKKKDSSKDEKEVLRVDGLVPVKLYIRDDRDPDSETNDPTFVFEGHTFSVHIKMPETGDIKHTAGGDPDAVGYPWVDVKVTQKD